MLIHLGKHHLGQTDRVDVTTEKPEPVVVILPAKEIHGLATTAKAIDPKRRDGD